MLIYARQPSEREELQGVCWRQRCADMYPGIDILRISVILTDTDTIRIVISLFERLQVRTRNRSNKDMDILCHGYSTDMIRVYFISCFIFTFILYCQH